MKKFMKVAVVGLILMTLVSAFVFAGGKKDGGGAAAGGGAEPFIVDLSTLVLMKMDNGNYTGEELGNFTRNQTPFAKGWDDLFLSIPATSLPSDLSQYQRLTISADYFNAAGEQIPHGDSNIIVSMIYDPTGDIRGPAQGPGPNTPIKEFNVGGFSGMIHKERGVRITFARPPQAVLFQNNAGSQVAFIEITSMVFHNGNYKAE